MLADETHHSDEPARAREMIEYKNSYDPKWTDSNIITLQQIIIINLPDMKKGGGCPENTHGEIDGLGSSCGKRTNIQILSCILSINHALIHNKYRAIVHFVKGTTQIIMGIIILS